MNKGKTVTISPPTRKLSTSLLSNGLFVVTHKVGAIVEVLDVIPSIPLRPVSRSTNEILHRAALIFLYCLLVKQTGYLERFGGISITVDKYGGWYLRVEAMEKIIGWSRCWL